MTDKIIVSVEDKKRKENGIYIFPFQGDESWETKIFFDTEEQRMTPRLIRKDKDKTHILTRKHFITLENDSFLQKGEQVFSLPKESLFLNGLSQIDGETREKVSGLVDHDLTQWSLTFLNTSVLLGLYRADPLLKEIDGSILFHGERVSKKQMGFGEPPFQEWNLKPLEMDGCTGPFFSTEDSLFFSQGKRYVQLSHAEITHSPSKIQQDMVFQMKGEITAYDVHKKGFVLADNQGNYFVKGEKNKSFSSTGTLDSYLQNGERSFLPSEATSVLFKEHAGKSYVFFGVDAGKIIVYSLDSSDSSQEMQYQTTLSLISVSQAIKDMEKEKDNRIYNLQVIGQDHVCFSFRNMFFRIGLEQLLSTRKNEYITSEDEKKCRSTGEYKKMLKGKYGFSGIKCAPHRILSWEFVGAL